MAEVKRGVIVWGDGLRCEVQDKVILDSVHFAALPGEFTAVMGPSGSGKTTLLNAMLSRLKGLKGEVHFNGVPVRKSGTLEHAHYVMAHDKALAYLTVKETLMFTARLRLPLESPESQAAHVDEVIQWLALEGCADTYVGGEWRKGISRGQMKRLAIAAELIGHPEVLILDEPTSGLDSHLALDLCIRLQRIAHETNTTVIASIHQPSQRAFDCFDKVILISNGGVLYSGPVGLASDYFETLYRHLPDGYSVPDYLLEVATIQEFTDTGHVKRKEGASTEATSVKAKQSNDESSSVSAAPNPHYSTTARIELLQQAFRQSDRFGDIQKAIEEAKNRELPAVTYDRRGGCGGWGGEFRALWKRSTLNSLRNPVTTAVIIIVNIVQALILGALFFQLQRDVTESEVAHIPVSKWAVWENPVMEFLAYGLDHDGFDPFLEVIESGVDGNDRSTIFDFMTNQDVIEWLPQVTECIRTRFEELHFAPSNITYPDWSWPVGSINGDDSVQAAGNEGNIVSLPLETTISMIVQLMQLFDYMITGKFEPPAFPSYIGLEGISMLGFWLEAIDLVEPFATQVTCCASLGYQFSTLESNYCDESYPWPQPPARKLGQWPEIAADLSRIAYKLQAALGKAMEHKIARRLSAASIGTSHSEALPIIGRDASVMPRRASSGSSLGGLAQDLWNLILNNPDSPLYHLIQNLGSWLDRVRNECENHYCDWVAGTADSIGMLFSNLAGSVLTVLNLAGAFFFGAGNIGFASYDVLLQFPKDRVVFNRETANKLHRTSSYFFAKFISDLPFQVIPAIIWSVIYFNMMGTGITYSWQPWAYLGVSIAISFCAYSFGYMISALSPRMEVAIISAPMILVIMLVQAGFMIRDDDYPAWIAWLRFFSIYRYGFFGFCTIEFPPGGSFGSLDNDMILPLLGVTETRLWANVVTLFGLAAGFRLCAFFALKYTNRRAGLEA